MHLTFHDVLHYAGVEISAFFFTGDMLVFWVVEESFGALSLFEGFIAAACNTTGGASIEATQL